MEKKCIVCNKLFKKKVNCSRKNWAKSKYCSLNCSRSHLHKGETPWNKGLTIEDDRVKKYAINSGNIKSEDVTGEKNINWLGDKAGYTAKHSWIYRRLGKANKCFNCDGKNAKRFHWHNISGEYKRDIDDWVQACPSCHKNIHLNKIIISSEKLYN